LWWYRNSRFQAGKTRRCGIGVIMSLAFDEVRCTSVFDVRPMCTSHMSGFFWNWWNWESFERHGSPPGGASNKLFIASRVMDEV
jgi:hypothetical protein